MRTCMQTHCVLWWWITKTLICTYTRTPTHTHTVMQSQTGPPLASTQQLALPSHKQDAFELLDPPFGHNKCLPVVGRRDGNSPAPGGGL